MRKAETESRLLISLQFKFSICLGFSQDFFGFVQKKSCRKGGNSMKVDHTNEMVFTPYITLKNGTRLYAKQKGKKVFCFPKKKQKNK